MLSQSQYQPRSDYGFQAASSTHIDPIGRHFDLLQPARLDDMSQQQHLPPLMSPTFQHESRSDGDATDEPGVSPVESVPPGKLGGSARRDSNANPVRKRTSRACDSCNQLRTKCDGRNPCGHCIDTGLTCGYARVPKKRGKVSKKDLARQAALRDKHASTKLQGGGGRGADGSGSGTSDAGRSVYHADEGPSAQPTSAPRQTPRQVPPGSIVGGQYPNNQSPTGASHASAMSQVGQSVSSHGRNMSDANVGIDQQYQEIDLNSFGSYPHHVMGGEGGHLGDLRASGMDFSNLYMGMGGLPGQALPLDGMDFTINSPPSEGTSVSGQLSLSHIKHPVLLPLFPFLKNIMTPSLAFELLEHFFTSTSPEFPHPASPYHITNVFRRRSFIGHESPRVCSPALLASMLWSAAWTSDARALTSPPSARARMCQKLLNLCIFLLNPLVHGDRIGKGAPDAERNGVSKAHPMGVQEMRTDEDPPVKIACGTVDDVVTYMHIAIVVSASEDKGASLRWWTSAWNLAKELKLGREPEPDARTDRPTAADFLSSQRQEQSETAVPEDGMGLDTRDIMPAEEREERRRIWWTLYLVDRHLSLCYNRRLMMLDSECVGLLRPMNEMAWQEGVFEPHLQSRMGWHNSSMAGRFEFTGPSTFGYFLPISTILGEIIDMHQRRMHPFLQPSPDDSGNMTGYDAQVREICHQQLRTFEQSMKRYYEEHMPPASSSGAGGSPVEGRKQQQQQQQGESSQQQQLSETQFLIATACAYGEHLMHVMYILLYDKWDPATLLADEDLWTGTPAFTTAMKHAVKGADAVADILKHDPQISFIPYLYGIYLLQGSFLLLVMADRLGTEANDQMISACETIVRAHESCVVTLNTEYQSALAQVRGRMPQDGGEQQRRRRETLSLYRWIGDGGGLAV